MEFLIVLCAHTQVEPFGFGGKFFEVKAGELRIPPRQDTVNHELDKVEGNCGCDYVAWIADAATSNGNSYPIGIFLLRSDLTHNHGVANFFSSVLRYIFKSNDAGSVFALHALVLGGL